MCPVIWCPLQAASCRLIGGPDGDLRASNIQPGNTCPARNLAQSLPLERPRTPEETSSTAEWVDFRLAEEPEFLCAELEAAGRRAAESPTGESVSRPNSSGPARSGPTTSIRSGERGPLEPAAPPQRWQDAARRSSVLHGISPSSTGASPPLEDCAAGDTLAPAVCRGLFLLHPPPSARPPSLELTNSQWRGNCSLGGPPLQPVCICICICGPPARPACCRPEHTLAPRRSRPLARPDCCPRIMQWKNSSPARVRHSIARPPLEAAQAPSPKLVSAPTMAWPQFRGGLARRSLAAQTLA